MKRKLIKQMLNEWRSNIWLIIELVIVTAVLQVIFTSLYVLVQNHQKSLGADLKDIYIGYLQVKQEGNEGFIPIDSTYDILSDLKTFKTRLSQNPHVELAAEGNSLSIPYLHNAYKTSITLDAANGKEKKELPINLRLMSPDIMKVLRIRGMNGETPEQLANILEKGDIILSNPEASRFGDNYPAEAFLGNNVRLTHDPDSLTRFRVGAVAYGLRRDDYEPTYSSVAYFPMTPYQTELFAFRIKPGAGHDFEESLSAEDLQYHNLYISDLISIERMRESIQSSYVQFIRDFSISAGFLILMIFLGFLGTFWFRTQQRVGEITIRKVNGADNCAIYRRFFSEGMILLVISTIMVIPVTIWLHRSNFFNEFRSWGLWGLPYSGPESLIGGAFITFIVLSMLIVAGIYWPARKATSIDPADALKDM